MNIKKHVSDFNEFFIFTFVKKVSQKEVEENANRRDKIVKSMHVLLIIKGREVISLYKASLHDLLII